MLSLKGIRSTLGVADFRAIAGLMLLEELVLDCDQPPEAEAGAEEVKWGLGAFPEGMLHLANMTHLTLSCHYGVTQLPLGISRLNKLQVRVSQGAVRCQTVEERATPLRSALPRLHGLQHPCSAGLPCQVSIVRAVRSVPAAHELSRVSSTRPGHTGQRARAHR